MISEQTLNRGLMITGGLLALGILGYLLFKEKEEQVEDAEFTIVQSTPTKENPKPVVKESVKEKSTKKEPELSKLTVEKKKATTDIFPLTLGSKNEQVKQLQVYLLRNHGNQRIVDDVFDQDLQDSVLKYLKVNEVSEALYKELGIAENNK